MQTRRNDNIQPKVTSKALDHKEQEGWILWALALSFFLAGAMMFFSLTI